MTSTLSYRDSSPFLGALAGLALACSSTSGPTMPVESGDPAGGIDTSQGGSSSGAGQTEVHERVSEIETGRRPGGRDMCIDLALRRLRHGDDAQQHDGRGTEHDTEELHGSS